MIFRPNDDLSWKLGHFNDPGSLIMTWVVSPGQIHNVNKYEQSSSLIPAEVWQSSRVKYGEWDALSLIQANC